MLTFSFSFIMALLSILSLNCHGFNLGTVQYLQRVGKEADIIFLQETWLSDKTSCRLYDAMPDFIVVHRSAVEDRLSSGILVGRPFGGTAVLIKKGICKSTQTLDIDSPRVCALRCQMGLTDDIVVASIYMPCNDGSLEHTVEFEQTVGSIQGAIDRCLGCKIIIGGDFNISKTNNDDTALCLANFCDDNNIWWLDLCQDSSYLYTYHNDYSGKYSLIDHFCSSADLVDSINAVRVLNDGDNVSDHFAITCQFAIPVRENNCDNTDRNVKLVWDQADIPYYQSVLQDLLSHINIPKDALICNNQNCTDQRHKDDLETYYREIVNCLGTAGHLCVPQTKCGIQKHWWSPELEALKQECIDITNLWSAAGRPRSGDINSERLKCKYRYKQAIKEAAANSDRAFNDGLFDKLCKKDNVGFWKTWRKKFCSHSLKPTNMLNGKCGDDNIAAEFTKYYQKVYQPNTPGAQARMRSDVDDLLDERRRQNDEFRDKIALDDMLQCIGNLKLHKAPGSDNIMGEHVINGGLQLAVHITILFNSMLKHAFVPSDFCGGIIVPLLKHKHGDATQLEMYRGITLAPVLSKLYELVLLRLYEQHLGSDPLQFGFKKKSSCIHALFTFNETVKHCTRQKGDKVFCGFLDASKAFDKVLHFSLFKKLLERGVPVALVETLKNWYGSLRCSVRWNSVLSESFAIHCGVRQGGILSPYLFAIYVDDLIDQIRKSGHGLRIGSVVIGCVAYADDIAVLSASCYGLQKIIDICDNFGHKWDIKFNPLKSQLMAFGTSNPDRCNIMLNGNQIPWASKVRYLGLYFLCNSGMLDMTEALRKFYGSFNNIMSIIGKQSNEMVAVHLAKTYCLPSLTYGCEVWNINRSTLHKMNVAWNACFRRIFGGFYRESVKPLQFFCGVLPVSHFVNQRKLLFWKSMFLSENDVLASLSRLTSCRFLATGSLYNVTSRELSTSKIKHSVWHMFANSVEL